MRRKSRILGQGNTIASVLAVVALAVLAAFLMAGMGLFTLSFSTQSSAAERARNHAEMAINTALVHLLKSESFGCANETVTVDGSSGPYNGSAGIVTFNPAVAQALNVPWSSNNMAQVDSKDACIGKVPGRAVQVIGTGISGDKTTSILATVHYPRYPYALAALDRIDANRVVVGSLADPAGLNLSSLDPAILLPSDLVSNDTSGNAITIRGGSIICGNAKACGQINVNDGDVKGEVIPGADAVNLPQLASEDFMPDSNPEALSPGERPELTVEGLVQCEGDLKVAGDITLKNGVLRVSGRLTVDGGVKGLGALLIKGDTIIRGASSLQGDEMTALICDGNVTLGGGSRTVFQGLVYAGGQLQARKLTILGSAIARGVGTSMLLEDTTVVNTGKAVQIDAFIKVVKGGNLRLFWNPEPTPNPGPPTKYPSPVSAMILDDFGIVEGDRGFRDMNGDGWLETINFWVSQEVNEAGEIEYRAGVDGISGKDTPFGSADRAVETQVVTEALGQGATMKDVKVPMPNPTTRNDEGKYFNFRVDPNEFLTVADRMRILEWRDVTYP